MTTTTSPNEGSIRTGSLTALRLPQLQEIASSLGIKGVRRLRKSELIDAINSAQKPGGQASPQQAPAGSTRPQGRRRANETPDSRGESPEVNAEPVEENTRGGQRRRGERQSAERRAEGSQDERGAREQQAPAREKRAAENERPAQERDNRNSRGQESRGQESQGSRGNDNRGNDNRGNDNRGNENRGNENRGNENRGNENREGDTRENTRRDRNDRGDRNDRNDRNDRRGRNRQRDRKRRGRGGDEEPEIREDDVLIPVAGILDMHDNYAFLRTSGYLPGPTDVYVSMNQIKKNGLRKGDAVVGAIRQPREDDGNRGKRDKYNALVRLDSVNGLTIDDARRRVEFSKLTPLYPQDRLRLETGAKPVATRIIDLVSPIGKGQRGLIVAPPKAGKTMIMQQIANAITTNNPEVHLMVVLVDERPEEVTDMQRAVQGEVIASTFDRPADDHTTIAELAIERAKRLVEMGQDVVVLLDNMTRLGRAYNLAQPASGRILSGGVDASALYPPKKFFGAARNIEGGGSLTILATALVETGSKMDEVIFEEFKGTGNMELRLSRHLADKRIFPAVDVNGSSTRRDENLMSPEEMKVMVKLRRLLSGLEQQQAVELLLGKLKETGSNVEFLMQVQKTTPLPKSVADD